jgi:hypothetical protein
LDAFGPGDAISGAAVTWTILNVVSQDGNEFIFNVTPQQQEAVDGIQAFALRKYGTSSLTYPHKTDALTPLPNVRGFFQYEEGDRTFSDTVGREWDIKVQNAIIPEDWEILILP